MKIMLQLATLVLHISSCDVCRMRHGLPRSHMCVDMEWQFVVESLQKLLV
ncbi:hypothetical protein KC19_12G047700 [Ceratodon purpureus]|uniref:Uncharacterized protein n=1 Tax=Ceratodon purpureus TaxID=3225 RepID=A0A8T0G641_CERPU|nr:hypothetical protein KC19_12G047700 [Ceratodon purpureus]